MAGRKLRVEWNDTDTPEFLKILYRAERDGKMKERLQALWLLRRGWTGTQVSAVVGVHYRTVHRWVRWYREGGLGEVRTRRQGDRGRKSYLDGEETDILELEIKEDVFGTAKELRDYIEKQCGVSYTMPGVYSLRKRLISRTRSSRSGAMEFESDTEADIQD